MHLKLVHWTDMKIDDVIGSSQTYFFYLNYDDNKYEISMYFKISQTVIQENSKL